MVLKGQFLERSVVVRSGGLMIDALFHRGTRAPACAVAPPHPAMGGSMVAPAVAELAWALTRAGHATLRFDYRGVGASQGKSSQPAPGPGQVTAPSIDPSRLVAEVEDLRAACEHLEATASPGVPVCCIGYSFGAAVALQVAGDACVSHLILIAPPTALSDFSALARVDKPTLIICAHQDALSDARALRSLLAPLGDRASLEVIPHADHGFRRGLPELGRVVAQWLRGDEPLPETPRALAEGEGESAVVELTLPEGDDEPLELDDQG
jgi:alpha/beta superfamily hydrolase